MLKVITAPTVEPLTLDEVKEQALPAGTDDDNLLTRLISVAREQAESLTKRSLAPKTLELVLDTWPGSEIRLPAGPVTAVSSVKYVDEDEAEQTLSTDVYEVDTDSLVARVKLRSAESWPDLNEQLNAVRVRYTAGFARADVPQQVKQWMLIRIASLYAQRENHVVGYGSTSVSQMGRSFADSLLDEITVSEV